MIPATAFAALLPALSLADAREGRARSLVVTRAARRQLATLLFPVCLTLVVFGPQILGAWLGPAFALAAGKALRILAVGVFLTGIAHLPMALLYGSGRPDLPAKIHLFEVIVHIPLTLVLVHSFGITGAALAWSFRCAEDLVFYEWARRRAIGKAPFDEAARNRERNLLATGFILVIVLTLTYELSPSPALTIGATGAALAIYFGACWRWVIGPRERGAWLQMLSLPRTASS